MKSGSRCVRRMHENEDEEECAVFIGGVDHCAALELALEMTELQRIPGKPLQHQAIISD
jgi:hypothetical protein